MELDAKSRLVGCERRFEPVFVEDEDIINVGGEWLSVRKSRVVIYGMRPGAWRKDTERDDKVQSCRGKMGKLKIEG